MARIFAYYLLSFLGRDPFLIPKNNGPFLTELRLNLESVNHSCQFYSIHAYTQKSELPTILTTLREPRKQCDFIAANGEG